MMDQLDLLPTAAVEEDINLVVLEEVFREYSWMWIMLDLRLGMELLHFNNHRLWLLQAVVAVVDITTKPVIMAMAVEVAAGKASVLILVEVERKRQEEQQDIQMQLLDLLFMEETQEIIHLG